MAPWGGREKAIGTNPWSIAAPAGRRGVAVMDIANTAVAPIPHRWAADQNGLTTTNAKDAIHGLILPMAGHKILRRHTREERGRAALTRTRTG